MTLQEKIALLEQQKKQFIEEVQEKVLEREVESQLRFYSNPAAIEMAAKTQKDKFDLEKLEKLFEDINHVLEAIPLRKSNGDEYVFRPSHNFNLGIKGRVLYKICTGIRYTNPAHKQAMLAIVGLSEIEIEQFIEAVGENAWFNERTYSHTIGRPMNVDLTNSLLEYFGNKLNINFEVVNEKTVRISEQASITNVEAELAKIEQGNKAEEFLLNQIK